MKTFTSILTSFSLAALLLAGCISEEPNYRKNPSGEGDKPSAEAFGYLAVESMNMRVVFDTETETGSDDTAEESKKPQATRSSRVNPSIETFIIEILDKNGNSVAKKSYAEWKAQTAPIELPVGNYKLKACSEETISDATWEAPVYTTEKEFSILKAETTSLPDLVCTLANIKVTMLYSADLYDLLSNETSTNITLGSQTLNFAKSETRAAYFKPEAEVNTLKFLLNGAFADTGKPVTLSKTINNVRAGQWRQITLVIEYADKGDITLDITVDSFVQDEEIVVDGTENLWEEVIDEIDPSTPIIVWTGHDITKPFQLTADMFDADNNCTESFEFDVTSANGIRSFSVSIDSDNEEFLTALKALIPQEFDLCTVTPESGSIFSILRGFGYPLGNEVINKKTLTLNIAQQIPLLYMYNGTFTFVFTVTDNNGLATAATMTLLVDKEHESAGPVIEWRGYDIDQPHKMTPEMTIAVDVASDAGIKAFEVTIESEILAPYLEMISLPQHFDLCTASGDMAKTLKDLGFPTGSAVVPPLWFDISQFVGLLIDMEAGEHKFILDVTDNNNVTTRKTIHLINEK